MVNRRRPATASGWPGVGGQRVDRLAFRPVDAACVQFQHVCSEGRRLNGGAKKPLPGADARLLDDRLDASGCYGTRPPGRMCLRRTHGYMTDNLPAYPTAIFKSLPLRLRSMTGTQRAPTISSVSAGTTCSPSGRRAPGEIRYIPKRRHSSDAAR